MKLIALFLTLSFLSLNTFAQTERPLLNSAEREGDKKLTAAQQNEYKRLLDEGAKNFEAGQLDQAEQNFLAILKFAPQKPAAYYNLGLVKYRQGHYADAITNFDQVVQMRSLYTGSAIYYKAISQYNLGDKAGALKTAKRQTESRYFYQPSQQLIQAIQKDSDPYFEVATTAFASQNYELCLLSLNDSVIADSAKGQDIAKKCREALNNTSALKADQAANSESARLWRLFASLRLSNSDNVLQANTNKQSKSTYYASISGEYIFDTPVQFGIGAGYEHYNIIDLSEAKNESLNIYIPIIYSWGLHQLQGQVFYNKSKANNTDDTTDTGLSASYSYSPDNWLLGVTGYWANKTSQNVLSDYKAGSLSNYNLNILKFIDQVTLGVTAGVSNNDSKDIPYAATFLPYASKSINYSLNASYAFNVTSKISAKYARNDTDFNNVYSVNGTDRHDVLSLVSLTYLHYFNKNLNAYLQVTNANNDSNYNDAEIVNKNYTENSVSLGLSYTY